MAIHVGAICESRKETAVYRPTLLIVPHNTIGQVVKEATRTFNGLLTIKVFYESQDTCSNLSRRMYTLDHGDFGSYMDSLMEACSVTMEELAFTGPVAADVAEYSQSVIHGWRLDWLGCSF